MTMAIYVPSVAICVPPHPLYTPTEMAKGPSARFARPCGFRMAPQPAPSHPPTPLPLQGSHPRA
jgi:hypothetical protein